MQLLQALSTPGPLMGLVGVATLAVMALNWRAHDPAGRLRPATALLIAGIGAPYALWFYSTIVAGEDPPLSVVSSALIAVASVLIHGYCGHRQHRIRKRLEDLGAWRER